MKSRILIVLKILISFIILFVLYTIHFMLDEFLFKKILADFSLNTLEVISAFIWSFIGGYITAKIVKESRVKGAISVSILTLIYMLLNYPEPTENILFFWVSLIAMISGILIGGYFFLKKFSNR